MLLWTVVQNILIGFYGVKYGQSVKVIIILQMIFHTWSVMMTGLSYRSTGSNVLVVSRITNLYCLPFGRKILKSLRNASDSSNAEHPVLNPWNTK
jgi:hypothetical protein